MTDYNPWRVREKIMQLSENIETVEFEDYLNEAREIPSIDSEKACVALCCKPTRDLINKNREYIKEYYRGVIKLG